VREKLRSQLTEDGKVATSIVNGTGDYGEAGEALAAGTYMVVLKRVDVDKLRCLPVSFSTLEKKVAKGYLMYLYFRTQERRGLSARVCLTFRVDRGSFACFPVRHGGTQ
jgi:hypothetical protein